MRVVLISSDEPPGVWLASELASRRELGMLVVPVPHPPADMPASHWSNEATMERTRERLIGDSQLAFEDLGPTITAGTPNDADAVDWLRSQQPDVIVDYRTGILKAEVLAVPQLAALNLHGGNPERYRGLDARSWTIYHRDFDNLMTCLHLIDPELDTGAIVGAGALPLTSETEFVDLLTLATEVGLDLVLAALAILDDRGRIPARPQLERGRYYSWMPASLKDDCISRFERHAESLPASVVASHH
jgi:methionyl-tRNA formyltransferase